MACPQPGFGPASVQRGTRASSVSTAQPASDAEFQQMAPSAPVNPVTAVAAAATSSLETVTLLTRLTRTTAVLRDSTGTFGKSASSVLVHRVCPASCLLDPWSLSATTVPLVPQVRPSTNLSNGLSRCHFGKPTVTTSSTWSLKPVV